MMTAEAAASAGADREIVFERVFDAPREMVFGAWTDPRQVAQWWGPDGFTNTVHEMDVRPDGAWRLTMHGPDGTDYPNRIVYHEVVRPQRLTYTHDDDGAGAHPPFHVTVTFDDDGGKTRLTMRMAYATAELRDHAARWGVIDGGQQMLGRLGAHLKVGSA